MHRNTSSIQINCIYPLDVLASLRLHFLQSALKMFTFSLRHFASFTGIIAKDGTGKEKRWKKFFAFPGMKSSY